MTAGRSLVPMVIDYNNYGIIGIPTFRIIYN